MRLRYAPFALLLACAPAMLAAEPWVQVDELPGGIPVELDRGSVYEVLDGSRIVLRGSFRRENVGWMMETGVAVDCDRELAKIRGIKLMEGDKLLSERIDAMAEFLPINPGSSEAIYFRALCGRDAESAAALPEPSEADEGADEPPADDSGDSGEAGE